LIRNTISAIEEQLKTHHPLIFRCHRGYMVNIRKILSVSGNAQGFKLFLEGVTETIPVSRSYVPEFREIVRKHL
jgi:DNA-binding LytR/AlgR family response regulator